MKKKLTMAEMIKESKTTNKKLFKKLKKAVTDSVNQVENRLPQYVDYKEKTYINPNISKKGKLPLSEVYYGFIESLSRVSEVSKAKGYELLNWLKPDVKCYFVGYLLSAADRHKNKFLAGEDFNIEKDGDGNDIQTEFDVLHLECAAYNLLMAAALYRQGRKDLDDRKVVSSDKTVNKHLRDLISNNECNKCRYNINSIAHHYCCSSLETIRNQEGQSP